MPAPTVPIRYDAPHHVSVASETFIHVKTIKCCQIVTQQMNNFTHFVFFYFPIFNMNSVEEAIKFKILDKFLLLDNFNNATHDKIFHVLNLEPCQLTECRLRLSINNLQKHVAPITRHSHLSSLRGSTACVSTNDKIFIESKGKYHQL